MMVYSIRWLMLVSVMYLTLSCENDVEDVTRIYTAVEEVDRYRDIEVTYSDSAVVRMKLIAPLLETEIRSPRDQVDYFNEGIFVTLYDETGAPTGYVTSNKAVHQVRKEIITMTDSVVARSVEGDTLRTEELIYDVANELVYTTGVFKYAKPDEEVYGYRFKSDPNFQNFSMDKMSSVMRRGLK